MSRPRCHAKAVLFTICVVLVCRAHAASSPESPAVTVDRLLQELQAAGVEILYSSYLVPPDALAPPARAGASPMQRATEALSALHLVMHAIAPNRYVVVRAPAEIAVAQPEQSLEEVSVYASRFSIEGEGLGEPRELLHADIERVPGSHDDALRALHSLPGMASNASGRPYIRGSLNQDVLVRYDGISLVDPFHFKNFQSLISAIDPAAVDRIEVFSGGFPVQFGTRAGGVIDIAAPSSDSGNEYRANLSLISAGVAAIGRSERFPLEWLVTARRSTLDLMEPVERSFGNPEFGDTLGRLRWSTERGAWSAGWLLLDDRLKLGTPDDDEFASADYHDSYVWLAREHRFTDALRTRARLVVTSAERQREGALVRPGVASGQLVDTRAFDGIDLSSDWSFERSDRSIYDFGGSIAATRAAFYYLRHSEFAPEVATAFARAPSEDLRFSTSPAAVTYSVYAANRRKWRDLEAELGLRVDGQQYRSDGSHTQVSPRLNLRYDMRERTRIYASAARFTQAQHVEEWRVEESQQVPDAAQKSLHMILGLEYESPERARWRLEARGVQQTLDDGGAVFRQRTRAVRPVA